MALSVRAELVVGEACPVCAQTVADLPPAGDDPDIDAVIMGKAPDFFEGVMMPEVYLAEALGCVGKPIMRVHTAGSVGGSTACVATSMIQSGVHETVLTIGWEKQSESNAMWALSLPQPFATSVNAGAGGYFSPIIRRYMMMTEAPELIG